MGPVERFYSGEPAGSVIVREGDAKRPLALRLDIRNHSPTGFAWGYGGSGPAQLALALLADALADDERAEGLYQEFKRRVVSALPSRWTLSRTRVLAYVEEIEHGLAMQRRAEAS